MGAEPNTFGPFTLDRGARALLSGGKPVALGQRAYALLETLIGVDGNVSKAALIEAAWPGTIVEEGNLTVQIAALRKALGTRPDGQEWIVTVPRVGYRLLRDAQGTPASQRRQPRLAVLPFHNLTGDPLQDDVVEGIVDEIVSAVGRFKEITIVPLFGDQFRGRVDAREVAREFDAGYVLDGSMRRNGDVLRVAARLVQGRDNASLWAETLETADAGFAAVQHVASGVVAGATRAIWWSEIALSTNEGADSSAVPDLIGKGIALLEVPRMGENRQAMSLLEAVVSAEPSNGRGVRMAAWGYEQRIHMGWPLDEGDVARGLELARRAIALLGPDAGALAHCGTILQLCGEEWDQGLSVATRAIKLNANDMGALFFGGVAHLKGGSLTEANALFERALALGTDMEGVSLAGLAHVAVCEGRFEDALDLGRRAVAGRPSLGWVHWPSIAAAALMGRLADARQALAAYRAHDPDGTLERIAFGQRGRDPSRSASLIEGLRLAGLE